MAMKMKASKSSKAAPKGREQAQQGPTPQEVTEGQQEGKGEGVKADDKASKADPIRELSPQKAQEWIAKSNLVFSIMTQEGPEGSASYDGYEMNGGECALMFTPTVTRKGKEVDGEMECRGVYSNWGYAGRAAFNAAWKAYIKAQKERERAAIK